ncbi:MAG TPA: toxin-antitoxin system HicB family antitoxin [Verrucomicrobiae bacterium]|jgi:predicted HicB family RNase H-like nuclease|nr:toxin-antitoxin system HicB family antitoxin [Verrucomicrobiae bacterium]
MTRKQIKELSAKYPKFVEWSDEDKVFIGQCPALFLGGVHGTDEAAVYKDLCEAVEEHLEILHNRSEPLPEPPDGKKFNGKILLRIEPALHRRLAAKAQAEGESLNQYAIRALVKA